MVAVSLCGKWVFDGLHVRGCGSGRESVGGAKGRCVGRKADHPGKISCMNPINAFTRFDPR